MSAAWITYAPQRTRIAPPKRSKRPYAHTAGHIRGRVYRMGYKTRLGDWMWGMEVINTTTGQVIASDNCADLASLVDLCDEATAAARAAWFWSYSPKKVRR
jgi:hypothetical protein